MFGRLLLAAMVTTGLLSGQRGGGGDGEEGGGSGMAGMGRGMGGGMSGGMGGGGGMSRVVRPSKLELFAEKLKLSKEQKDELIKILSAGREEATPLRQPIEQERIIITEFLNGKADVLKKSLESYAALMAQMAGVEAKAFAKVLATLKPNQQSKSAQAFELLAGTFDPPSSGRGGMGRGGQRGRN